MKEKSRERFKIKFSPACSRVSPARNVDDTLQGKAGSVKTGLLSLGIGLLNA
ncbi:MAG: hypothetical protein QXU11_03865 [Thermoproteota archaeon]